MLDVACRLLLVVFVVGVIVYRRECIDGVCRRKSPWVSDLFRLSTGVVATIGFFVPVLGVVLAILLMVTMVDIRYESKTTTAKAKYPVTVSQRVDGARSERGRGSRRSESRTADRTT